MNEETLSNILVNALALCVNTPGFAPEAQFALI
jgi:hypothetical protein